MKYLQQKLIDRIINKNTEYINKYQDEHYIKRMEKRKSGRVSPIDLILIELQNLLTKIPI